MVNEPEAMSVSKKKKNTKQEFFRTIYRKWLLGEKYKLLIYKGILTFNYLLHFYYIV
jgi:hypothetical protein